MPFAVVFGLAGLAIDARETEGWAANLTEAEAEVAVRYALRELNGFPFWFGDLFAAFPDLIARLTLAEVRWKLASSEVGVRSQLRAQSPELERPISLARRGPWPSGDYRDLRPD